MGSKKKTVPFAGTKEQEAELLKVIKEHKNDKGALMPILQAVRENLWRCYFLLSIFIKSKRQI